MNLIPEKPRYGEVSKRALFFLLRYKLSSLPIPLDEIINELGCSIRTYSFHAKKIGCSVQDVCDAFGSIDGYSVYSEITGKYKITYNDLISSPERIRFTIMHEIAHIYLNHFIDFSQTQLRRGGLNEEDLIVLDQEANNFVPKVLAPEIVLLHIGWKLPKIIHRKCALSIEASKYRSQKIIEMEIKRNYITGLELKVLRQFNDFIHRKTCENCKHYFIIANAKYCPMCGSESINWGEGEELLIYDGFELDQNSKAKKCPKCENEEIDKNFNNCKICGVNLVNKCIGDYIIDNDGDKNYREQPCGTPCDGNARYCVKCGCQTSFYEQGILNDWDFNQD